MDVDPPVRRRDVGDLPDDEILDEGEQQEIIDDLEKDYREIAANQVRFIAGYGGGFFVVTAFLSFATKNYALFFLPGLAGAVLAAMVYVRPNWALASSLSVEALALIEAVRIWQAHPKLLILGIHAAYAFAIWLRVDSARFTRSIPQQLQNLKNLKYHAKVA
jgi:hypothetical protein